jgi:hypothetical protein
MNDPKPILSRKTCSRFLAFLVAVGALAAPGWPAELGGAERASASSWVGTVQGKVVRSSRWVSTTGTARGDFWFTVGRKGRVSGRAVVVYEPSFDTDRLNALLSYAKSAVGSALGAIPLFGGFAGNQLNLIVGVRVAYDDPMPIREGTINGRLSKGRLSIDWAGKQPTNIPFRALLANLSEDEELTSGSLAAPSPWPGTATVRGGTLAISTYKRTSQDDGGVTETSRSYWSARRVGGG